MTNDKDVVLIIDSSDEEEVVPYTQHSATITIESDDEELEKNTRVEKIIMCNVEKRTLLTANVNKLFQKDTRLTNLKRNVKLRKGTSKLQQSPTRSSTLSMTQFAQEQLDRSSPIDNDFSVEDIINGTPNEKINDDHWTLNANMIQNTRTVSSPRREDSQYRRPSIKLEKTEECDEDNNSVEEDLDYYVSFVNGSRKRRSENDTTPKSTNMQCPICYLLIQKSKIAEHASECDGKKNTTNGIVRKSISAAVLLEQEERAKKRKGMEETGPTNYYLESDLSSTDGAGFNNEITGLNWESAGQTRFG